MRTRLLAAITFGVLALPAQALAHEEPILPLPNDAEPAVVMEVEQDNDSNSGVLLAIGGAGVVAALGTMLWSVSKKRQS
jgi:hypothetical protein